MLNVLKQLSVKQQKKDRPAYGHYAMIVIVFPVETCRCKNKFSYLEYVMS